MQQNSYQFFQNRDCEFFPCKPTNRLNCLFCFCPLYHEDDCGGDFSLLTDDRKDCSQCLLPHTHGGYQYIINRLKDGD